jgi:hypothetical protein
MKGKKWERQEKKSNKKGKKIHLYLSFLLSFPFSLFSFSKYCCDD